MLLHLELVTSPTYEWLEARSQRLIRLCLALFCTSASHPSLYQLLDPMIVLASLCLLKHIVLPLKVHWKGAAVTVYLFKTLSCSSFLSTSFSTMVPPHSACSTHVKDTQRSSNTQYCFMFLCLETCSPSSRNIIPRSFSA